MWGSDQRGGSSGIRCLYDCLSCLSDRVASYAGDYGAALSYNLHDFFDQSEP